VKELWNKFSNQEKIQVCTGFGAGILGFFALSSTDWPMGIALLICGGLMVFVNVKKYF
jgi:hypothetical protein